MFYKNTLVRINRDDIVIFVKGHTFEGVLGYIAEANEKLTVYVTIPHYPENESAVITCRPEDVIYCGHIPIAYNYEKGE